MELSDSPIKCVFIGHFHCVLGPKVMYQVPSDYVSKELFYTLSTYIIPKTELSQTTLTVTTKNIKLLGYPIAKNDPKYNRNMFYFNVCFVFDEKSQTSQYEPIVKKLAEFFHKLEIESMYLYKSEQSPETQKHITSILSTVLNGLNMHKKCHVSACDYVIHLCVVKVPHNPPIPSDFDVPVFVSKVDLKEDDWDLVTRQVGSFIDGVNHVARIAELSTLDLEVVSGCIQNLVYYNVVTLVDLFRYSNMYVCTTKIVELTKNKDRYNEAIDFISRPNGPKTTIRNILTMFAAMRQGSRLMDVCMRLNPVPLNINERNLVLYGLINGFIRHLKKYPILLKEDDVDTTYMGQYYNGINSLEIVSSYNALDLHSLDKVIEEDLRIMSVWK